MKGLNYEQIGAKCGVTKRTIDRDIHIWLETGNFETWIKEEWVRLHNLTIHDNPELAYKELSRILGRMVTRRVESKHTEEIREIKLIWKVQDDSGCDSE